MTINMDDLVLAAGQHTARTEGVCLLEACAWVAGEPHSDHPECVCPVLAAFGRQLNDQIRDDALRTKLLKPMVVELIGTRSDPANQRRRMFMLADLAVREWVPMALESRKRPDLAKRLRELDPITDEATACKARAAAYAADASLREAAHARERVFERVVSQFRGVIAATTRHAPRPSEGAHG